MEAATVNQGRFLGGRPPYGYVIVSAGPHPNPSKAADGITLHVLEADPVTAPVVQRIFDLYVGGTGLRAIAARLNTEGLPCPSAHDPNRNTHRLKDGWQASTVRAVLTNPGTSATRSGAAGTVSSGCSTRRTSPPGQSPSSGRAAPNGS